MKRRPARKAIVILQLIQFLSRFQKTRAAFTGVCFLILTAAAISTRAASFTIQPAGNIGFDVLADGVVIAPIRLAAGNAIQADTMTTTATGLRLSGFHSKDPAAITFAADDFVSIELPAADSTNAATAWEPVVSFKLTLSTFNTNRWLAMFPDAPAPFHFLVCAMSTAQVWHQRGWLNATPRADPFPLLQDVHSGSPEISCLWNRNWSFLCPWERTQFR